MTRDLAGWLCLLIALGLACWLAWDITGYVCDRLSARRPCSIDHERVDSST